MYVFSGTHLLDTYSSIHRHVPNIPVNAQTHAEQVRLHTLSETGAHHVQVYECHTDRVKVVWMYIHACLHVYVVKVCVM